MRLADFERENSPPGEQPFAGSSLKTQAVAGLSEVVQGKQAAENVSPAGLEDHRLR
jgi:hypothetical protein